MYIIFLIINNIITRYGEDFSRRTEFQNLFRGDYRGVGFFVPLDVIAQIFREEAQGHEGLVVDEASRNVHCYGLTVYSRIYVIN